MNTLRDGTIRVCREVRAIIPGGEASFFFFGNFILSRSDDPRKEKNLPSIIYPNIRYSFRKTFDVPPPLPHFSTSFTFDRERDRTSVRVYRKNKTEGSRGGVGRSGEEKRMKEEKIAEREREKGPGIEAVYSSPGILANYSADSAPSLKINATLSASRPAIWCNERARRRSRGME